MAKVIAIGVYLFQKGRGKEYVERERKVRANRHRCRKEVAKSKLFARKFSRV